VPPRRPPSGRHRKPARHRKPRGHGGPAYITAATLAAFTVSGFNVPGAIGAARVGTSSPGSTSSQQQAGAIAAGALRQTLVTQQEARASRARDAQATAVRLLQVAAEKDRKAREAARPKWVLPVDHYRLTAGFGEYGLWSSMHTGQDFAAPEGTPIHAVGDGKIIFAGYDGAYGNKIAIQHPDGTVTWYAHMSAFIRTSGTVKAGEVIGRIGSTGHTTGPHLHLEVRPHNGDPIPPLTWLREHGLKP
jgi:murein DD-endopeptidase MepM/ murein hydrolase activator NlpD